MRYNIFNHVHKGLRAMLYETALVLQKTNFNDEEEKMQALDKIKQVMLVFEQHAAHEDHYIFPALQEYEPSVKDAFAQEHAEGHELAENLRNLVIAFETDTTPVVNDTIGHTIFYSFISFMTFSLDHMNREETIMNEKLWRYYSDEALLAMKKKIVASIPADQSAVISAWMMKGMSNHEITTWLKDVQTNAPEYVFSNVFGIAERVLPFDRFRKILEELTEGAMVA